MADKSRSGRSRESKAKSTADAIRKGYTPYDRGYTPVAFAPKKPKPLQGGTGQVTLSGAPQQAES
jgi:hypothetical protein